MEVELAAVSSAALSGRIYERACYADELDEPV